MSQAVDAANNLPGLRERAVARLTPATRTDLGQSTASLAMAVLYQLASSPDTAPDALALLHELQVHQVELELQAEELRQAHDDLESALFKQTYRVEHAPVGYLTIAADSTLQDVNIAAARLLGAAVLGRKGLNVTNADMIPTLSHMYVETFGPWSLWLFLIGALAVPQPAVAAATGVVLASLLAARERLHRFATDWLSEQELHDALLLAALVLVLLPLLPTVPLSWMGSLSLHQVLMLMIVILGMQAAGHLAQRLMGDRAGLAASGLLGGFVSSTATISAMGSLVRSGQASMRLGLCASVLSTAATWLQMVLMASVVSPKGVSLIVPLVVVGALVPLSVGAALWRDQTSSSPVDGPRGQMLRPREAVIVALLLVGGAVLVHSAQAYGVSGVFMGTGLAAVADAHAPVASLLSLFEGGRLSADHLLIGLMVALSVNGATRTIAALVTGGPRFAMGVGGSLLVNVLVGWAWVLA